MFVCHTTSNQRVPASSCRLPVGAPAAQVMVLMCLNLNRGDMPGTACCPAAGCVDCLCAATAMLPPTLPSRPQPAVIEKYTRNTRFCLICNYVSKIIPALQSRCTRFRFPPLDEANVRQRLQFVIDAEK